MRFELRLGFRIFGVLKVHMAEVQDMTKYSTQGATSTEWEEAAVHTLQRTTAG